MLLPRPLPRPFPRTFVCAFLGACALACVPNAGRAQSKTPFVEAYREKAAKWERIGANGLTREEARDAARELALIKRVQEADGSEVVVANEATIAALEKGARTGAAKDLEGAAAHLRSLRGSIEPPLTPLVQKGDPQKQAAKILAGAEYKQFREVTRARVSWWDAFWERVLRGIASGLEKFFGLFSKIPAPKFGGPLKGFGEGAVYVLYFIAAVAVAVALYFLGRMLWGMYGEKWGGAARRRRRGGGFDDADLAGETIADPLSAAHALAAQGEYRGALRLAYIAGLRRLQNAGLLRLEENKTNWEYQRTLRSRSAEVYGILLPATRLFDWTWYGRRTATKEEFEAVVAAHNRLPDTRSDETAPQTAPANGAPPAPKQTLEERIAAANAAKAGGSAPPSAPTQPASAGDAGAQNPPPNAAPQNTAPPAAPQKPASSPPAQKPVVPPPLFPRGKDNPW